MEHPLADFRLKLNRASAHLEALKREVDAWFEKHPYGITGKYDPGPPEKYVLYFRFFEPVPREWGVLIGDFLHSCRSALDYLAWQLVQANGHAPDRRTQFPIVLNPCDWLGGNGASRVKGASPRHIDMVERLQPYHRRDSDGWAYAQMNFAHPLAVLSVLSNEDKHRVLVATVAALRELMWDVVDSRDVEPVADLGTGRVGGSLIDGSPLIEIPVTATGPNPELEVKFQERAHIAFLYIVPHGDVQVHRDLIDLLSNLDRIAAEVRRIFEVFVREFI